MTDFSNAISVASSGMKAQATRLRHVSENIANADTPGFVARDVPAFASYYAPPDDLAHQRATRAAHLNGLQSGHSIPIIQSPGDGAPNGNQVSLETELLKSVEAKRAHDRALAIYKSALKILRSTTR